MSISFYEAFGGFAFLFLALVGLCTIGYFAYLGMTAAYKRHELGRVAEDAGVRDYLPEMFRR